MHENFERNTLIGNPIELKLEREHTYSSVLKNLEEIVIRSVGHRPGPYVSFYYRNVLLLDTKLTGITQKGGSKTERVYGDFDFFFFSEPSHLFLIL